VRVIGADREVPIYGGRCGVRRQRREERAIGGAVNILKSRVTSGPNPGLNIPLTREPFNMLQASMVYIIYCGHVVVVDATSNRAPE
jgi:hypothetical protein